MAPDASVADPEALRVGASLTFSTLMVSDCERVKASEPDASVPESMTSKENSLLPN